MAELIAGAFLSSAFQVTLEKLASRDFRGCIRKESAEKLEITLNSINQLLDDAETKQYQNMYVKNWLNKLKHEVYEVEQLLDEIATKTQQKGKAQRLLSPFTDQFKSRIKHLLEKLEFLAKQKDELRLTQRSYSNEGVVSFQSSKRSPTASLVDESCIFGRDDDKNKIINYLLSDNDNCGNQVTIVSIMGLGGIGKTSLAQLVYNDEMINKQFELKAWVYVSETFDIVGLTKKILKSFNSSTDSEELDQLQLKLQQTLTGKKCLLVLDDVWNGSGECWEKMLLPFNHGSSGCKIIVTTRDKHIALVIKSDQQHHLKQLEESDSWSLFVKHAFRGRDVSQYPDLKSIGKKIVDKCGGLPIAVKILGNLLQRNFFKGEWLEILETDMWHLSERENNINATLRLSYHNLPLIQKRCFAYCSILPKGYMFQKGELIKFWMADGLLKCHKAYKSDEELGDVVFNDLESISFFQESINGYDHGFVMHDLVNDLAKSVSGEFCIQIDGVRVEGILEKTRHIWCSLQLNFFDKMLEPICELKGLRTLMLISIEYRLVSSNVQRDLFSRLKCLRMLSFRYCSLSKLVGEISNLKLLRYLDLSFTFITSLPDSICELYNLQTLLLNGCELTELPSNFSKLINLRHLELPCIKKMPKDIGKLNNLQTLSYFIVKDHNGSDLKELGKLNHLHGTIDIEGLGNVIDPLDVTTTILKDKKYLEEVNMKFNGIIGEMNGSIVGNVLEALQPNNNLKRLAIEEYKGNSFPNWLSSEHLPNLVSLELFDCTFSSMLPPLWKLPSLKELYIKNCGGIKIIGEESYDNDSTIVPFKSLEILEFRSMSDWEEWYCPKGFPLLIELSITNCPKLKRGLPQHLPSLQKLIIFDCKKLEVSIPKGTNIIKLDIQGCDIILVSELSSTLKEFILCENEFTEFSTEQNLFDNVNLEELKFIYGESSLVFGTMCIRNWFTSPLPFSIHSFTNLHSLDLYNCPELESFPPGSLLPNLSKLKIENCPKLIILREEWDLFEFNSLKEFSIIDHDFENVESFPEDSLLPPTLESLNLSKCFKLRIMNYKGLFHLNSLNSLSLYGCFSLERLPEEGLPNSISLLWIECCPLLKQLYQKEEGECWHTISHIPYVWIDEIEQHE